MITRPYLLFLIILFMVHMPYNLYAQEFPWNPFETNTDIGDVKIPGKVMIDQNKQSFILAGSGYNIWFDHDEFHFLYRKFEGDFTIRAHVQWLGDGADPHRKAGWMVRESLKTDAPHVSATLHGDGLASLQFRKIAGSNMDEQKLQVINPDVIQLSRNGNVFSMSAATFGQPLNNIQQTEFPLSNNVYVGLFVCSHNKGVTEKAKFTNIRVVVPAREGMQPYQDFLSSNLEIVDVFTGHRKILYHHPQSVQAPNWRPDNSALIYNHDGLLYNFSLKNFEPTTINTGFAIRNNNDHVLSFDGKWLGISHHSEGKSMIYVIPSTGGIPDQVTTKGPSYLHGWSPDNKWLTYTGRRNGNYDIYKIPVEGGKEIRLTDAQGLDDGSEYTPDGSYIYFNSSRTGTMQIWRMKPDGTKQEQVTFDNYNDWFPHISPDGKWIAFLSYMPDVPAGDHPFYKHVYLRLMPYPRGSPKVIAYVYGGQGTINVPSWSPDSKKIGFVSNSGDR